MFLPWQFMYRNRVLSRQYVADCTLFHLARFRKTLSILIHLFLISTFDLVFLKCFNTHLSTMTSVYPDFRSSTFLLDHIKSCMNFFDPSRCVDKSGGLYHFFAEDGTVFDKTTRVLVTEARFIFTYKYFS